MEGELGNSTNCTYDLDNGECTSLSLRSCPALRSIVPYIELQPVHDRNPLRVVATAYAVSDPAKVLQRQGSGTKRHSSLQSPGRQGDILLQVRGRLLAKSAFIRPFIFPKTMDPALRCKQFPACRFGNMRSGPQ